MAHVSSGLNADFTDCVVNQTVKVKNPQTQSRLFSRLPGEIRNRIYFFVLSKECDPEDDGSSEDRVELSTIRRPALARTCRLIEREALSYYFSHEKFRFTITVDVPAPMSYRLERKTQAWMRKAKAGDMNVRDIVFRISLPNPHLQHDPRPDGRVHLDFISVLGKSGPRLDFMERRDRALFVDRMPFGDVCTQNFTVNDYAWEAIEVLTQRGLALKNVEDVGECLWRMAKVETWESWGETFDPLKKFELRWLRTRAADLMAWCLVACEYRREKGRLAKKESERVWFEYLAENREAVEEVYETYEAMNDVHAHVHY